MSQSAPAERAALIEFEHVTVTFDETRALDDVSFRICEGETRILMGAASSGKTVVLKTAMGLVRPRSGRVILMGEDITDRPETELFGIRSKLGMLFQESALFDSMNIA